LLTARNLENTQDATLFKIFFCLFGRVFVSFLTVSSKGAREGNQVTEGTSQMLAFGFLSDLHD